MSQLMSLCPSLSLSLSIPSFLCTAHTHYLYSNKTIKMYRIILLFLIFLFSVSPFQLHRIAHLCSCVWLFWLIVCELLNVNVITEQMAEYVCLLSKLFINFRFSTPIMAHSFRIQNEQMLLLQFE